MIIKRVLENNSYQAYLLPENLSEENIKSGIPLESFSIRKFDLEAIDAQINDFLTAYMVKYQTTPGLDTVNQILRTVFLRELNKLGEIYG